MSERVKKITTAQAQAVPEALPAIGEMVQHAAGAANEALKKSEEVAGETHKGDKKEPGDFINELNLSQQSGREQLVGFGIDKEKYNQYTKDLMDAGMPSQMTASKFIQDVASVASTAAVSFEDAFAVGKAIYRRNIYSPDRAVAILRVLAKYEDMVPGIGIFAMAKSAAMGQFNPQALTAVRFSLMGVPGFKGNMNESRDLQQAFDGINAPNSQLGEALNETNMAHQRMQAVQEQMLLQARMINLMYQKERDKKLTEIYAYWAANLPEWVKNNKYLLDTLLRGMNGLATANAVKNSIMRGFGVGGDTGLGTGQAEAPNFGFVQSDVKRERKVFAAGESGTAPVDLAPNTPIGGATPPAQAQQPQEPTQEQMINQNINQANSGDLSISQVADIGVRQGKIASALAQEMKNLETQLSINQSALEQNYKSLVELMSAGYAPQSMFASDFTSGIYVTPDQIDFYAKPASANALVVIKIIQSLISIAQQYSTSATAEMVSAYGGGIHEFSALMRNLEAKLRFALAEAQKKRLQIFDISVLGPIDQQVRVLEPQYKQMKSGMDLAASFRNVGADAYVMPFTQIAMQMSELYNQASEQYKQAGRKIAQQEPALAQYCKSRSDQMAAAGQMAMTEAVTAMNNLINQQSGGQLNASKNEKFVRLAEETSKKEVELAVEDGEGALTDVEAKPLPVDEYWDKLYKNDPPYGDVMVHPEKHRDEPSWKMRPKHRVKRLN